MAGLPGDGAALLAFKQCNEAPPELRFGRAALALDDPESRLAELADFDLPTDEDERQAASAASAASATLAAATNPAADLLPWFAAMEQILAPPWDQEPDGLPVRIAESIYLGDADAAANVARLSELGVTHVLNASNVEDAAVVDKYRAAGIAYLLLNAEDDVQYEMRQHCDVAAAFVQAARDASGACLVHCQAGINRSGFIVVAELVVHGGRNLLDAVAHCSARRGPLLWNQGFRVALLELAREKGRLGVPLMLGRESIRTSP